MKKRIKPSSVLNGSFEEVECHLLPQPGTQFEEQDEDFTLHRQFIVFDTRIANFVTNEPVGLEPKRFNGKPVTCLEKNTTLVDFLETLIVWLASTTA